jgi:hypothetical protein
MPPGVNWRMRALWVTMISVGVACLVLGLGSFVYGAWVLDGTEHFRLGPFSGSWRQGDYALAGTIVAALGAAFVTAGGLGMRGDARRFPP